jgi:hypothetical protein
MAESQWRSFMNIRQLFAPITIRFQTTDDLEATLFFLSECNRDKLSDRLVKNVARMEKLIAKELIRRGVKIWEF